MPKIKPTVIWLRDGTKIVEDGKTKLELTDNGLLTIYDVEQTQMTRKIKSFWFRTRTESKMMPQKVPIRSYPLASVKEIDWGYCSPEVYSKIQEELKKSQDKGSK